MEIWGFKEPNKSITLQLDTALRGSLSLAQTVWPNSAPALFQWSGKLTLCSPMSTKKTKTLWSI